MQSDLSGTFYITDYDKPMDIHGKGKIDRRHEKVHVKRPSKIISRLHSQVHNQRRILMENKQFLHVML